MTNKARTLRKSEKSKISQGDSGRIQQSNSNRSMYFNGFQERHDLEQYFWTKETVSGLQNAIEFYIQKSIENDNSEIDSNSNIDSCCCLCTPTLGHAFWESSKIVSVYDIDTRFDYLPGFYFFDLRWSLPKSGIQHEIVVFDPPFFYIPMNQLYDAVLRVLNDRKSAKLLIGFLKREEPLLLQTFKDFNLKKTKFKLMYSSVSPNKWTNYALYSNVDLPGIKRIMN